MMLKRHLIALAENLGPAIIFIGLDELVNRQAHGLAYLPVAYILLIVAWSLLSADGDWFPTQSALRSFGVGAMLQGYALFAPTDFQQLWLSIFLMVIGAVVVTVLTVVLVFFQKEKQSSPA